MDDKKFTAVSLFAGAGGLDMGFDKAGIHTVWANDFNHDACETYKIWSDAEVVEGDIGKVDFSVVPETDVILGGFPCQGFSLAGPRKVDDSRNVLYKHFVRLVEMKQPKAFVAENVKGLLTLGEGTIAEAIVNEFADKGYNVSMTLVNAADYGVPQDRMRVIIIGIRNDIYEKTKFVFPEPVKDKVTLEEALKDLPEPDKEDVCAEAYSPRYMSRNRKRDWNEQSFTIPAMAKQVALHPSSPDMIKIDKDLWKFGEGITRRLSYKEAAAIQTFPKDLVFCGNLTSKYKQIGNAVPVKLGYAVGKSVYDMLMQWNEKTCGG